MMKQGFTLVELLVVMVIIALVASVSIPLVLRARHRADMVDGMGVMRNISVAINGYLTDRQGRLPYLRGNSQFVAKNRYSEQLVAALEPYLGVSVRDGEYVPGTAGRAFLRKADPWDDVCYWVNPWVYTDGGATFQPFGYRAVGNTPAQDASRIFTVFKPEEQVALIDYDRELKRPGGGLLLMNSCITEPIYGDCRLALFYDWHVEAVPVSENFYLHKNW
jgi:prepilin-type N-terminal cleavage/methylation domain-containing protein